MHCRRKQPLRCSVQKRTEMEAKNPGTRTKAIQRNYIFAQKGRFLSKPPSQGQNGCIANDDVCKSHPFVRVY